MTDNDERAYEDAFPGLPIWKPGDLVRVVEGSDAVVGSLGRVQRLSRAMLSYSHFNCAVEVGTAVVYCLPDSLEDPGILEIMADVLTDEV